MSSKTNYIDQETIIMITRQQRRIIQESRQEATVGSRQLLAEKINSYQTLVLNEGFFDKIKQLGQGVASGAKALMGGASGGATAADLSAELPEMKQLKVSLNKVEQMKNKLLSFKLSDIKGIDASLDTYVQTLVDTFEEWKHVTESEGSNTLPEVVEQVTAVFKTAKTLIAGLMKAFDDANEVLKRGVPADSKVATRSALAPVQRPRAPTDALTAHNPSRTAGRKLSAV